MADRESEYKKLRAFLNKNIRGKNTDAILRSVASGPAHLVNNVEAVNDSLYIVSAKDRYLDQRLGDKGVVRPAEVGLSDEVFREIGIEITNRKQVRDLVHQLLRILYGEIFTRSTSISQEAENFSLEDGDNLIISFDGAEPVEITFTASQFQNISSATAQEVADAITKSLRKVGGSGAAFTQEDGSDVKVVIISSTDGPSSSVRVLGGKAQNALKFDEIRPTSGDASTQWTLTQEAGGAIRATWTGGADPSLGKVKIGDYVTIYSTAFDILNRGTFTIVDVTGGTLGNSYVEFVNPNGIEEIVTQGTAEGVLFYNPKIRTLISNERYAAAFQTSPRTLEVFMPATTKIVRRNRAGAAHIQDDGSAPAVAASFAGLPQGATSIVRLQADNTGVIGNSITLVGNETITPSAPIVEQPSFSSNFGWSSGFYGQTFTTGLTSETANSISFKLGNSGSATGSVKFVLYATSGGLPTGAPLGETGSINLASLPAGSGVSAPYTELTLTSPIVLSPSTTYAISMEASFTSGAIQFAVDNTNPYAGGSVIFDPTGTGTWSPTASVDAAFSVNSLGTAVEDSVDDLVAAWNLANPTNTLSVLTGGSETIDDGISFQLSGGADEILPTPSETPGPYTYDTTRGFVIGEEAALTTEELDTNSDSILFVDDASDFPDEEGDIIIGLGTSHQEGPVPYISRPSGQTLRINPSYKFKNRHPIGTDIAFVAQKSPANPAKDGSDYPFYLTDSVAGRIYAEELIKEITATGIVVIIYILYPNDIGLGKWGDQENSEKYYVWGTEEDLIG